MKKITKLEIGDKIKWIKTGRIQTVTYVKDNENILCEGLHYTMEYLKREYELVYKVTKVIDNYTMW